MNTENTASHDPGQAITERLVSCLPAASFEMETLCRLAGIRLTAEIPTAAVECSARPRLLLNPEFLERHCRRDEHLFLLVMHELHHIILGHTRLFPRVTRNQNIAFDAVINSILARQFSGPEFRGFFEALNPEDAFPALLLRPPAGWPHAPVYPSGLGPRGTTTILRRLYPRLAETGARGAGVSERGQENHPTYGEILALLERGKPGEKLLLLGDHSDPEGEQKAADDPQVGAIVRSIISRWPPPPFPLTGRSSGGPEKSWASAFAPCADAVRRAFGLALRRVLVRRPGGAVQRSRGCLIDTGGLGVLPHARDRLVPARRRLGLASPLYTQPAVQRARVLDSPSTAHVYLDVSGSMSALLPRLLDLLLPYAEGGRARVYQFSTTVSPLSTARLRQGCLATTFGTAIDPVLEHALGEKNCGRILLLTDGCTGSPSAGLEARLAARRMKVHLVLPAESATTRDLAAIATTTTILPRLDDGSAPWRP